MDVEKNISPNKSERYSSERSLEPKGFFRSQRYKLKPRRYFGASHKSNKDLLFYNDSTLIHLSGRTIIVDNLVERTQRFINLKEVQSVVNMIALSRNRKFVAVSERRAESAVISVYSMMYNKHIQTYMPPLNPESKMLFSCIAYTCDSAYLVAIAPEPGWNIVFYSTKNGDVHSIINKLGNRSETNPVVKIVCNPSDPKQLIALGYDFFQLMKFKSPYWVNVGYEGDLRVKITGSCWVTALINVLGTSDGRLIFIESGHVQGVYDASNTEEIDITLEEVDKSIFGTLNNYEKYVANKRVYENEVKVLAGFKNGFAYSCKAGEVIVFESNDELEYKLRWHKKAVYLAFTPIDDKLMDYSQMSAIQQICVSPNNKIIACSTIHHEIYYGNMKYDFSQKQINYVYLKKLFDHAHHGPVGSISVANWKPFYITSGVRDYSIILWNHNLNTVVFRKEFSVQVCGASLHPTGLFCLVGFSERIRFGIVYHTGIKFIREISVSSCSSVVFSQGGHLFAAVCGKTIYTYSASTFSCNYIFKGHSGPINCVYFSTNDYYIYSSGIEGSIYKWDISDGTRECDYFTRNNANMDIDFSEEEDLIYIVGTDGCLRELFRENYFYQLRRTFDFHLGSMYSVKMVNSGETILVAGEEGGILAIGCPIFSPIKFRQYTIHSAPVRRLLIAPEENILMSVSDDGSVCLWDLIPPESSTSTIHSSSPNSMITLYRNKSGDSSTSPNLTLDEPLEKYMGLVMMDMEKWIEDYYFMEDFASTLIETNKANDIIVCKIKAGFEKLIKQMAIVHAQNVADLEKQIKILNTRGVINMFEYQGKLEDMSLDVDDFDNHFMMRRCKVEERSCRIFEKCKEKTKKFYEQTRNALKEFAMRRTKILVRVIDRHQMWDFRLSQVLEICKNEVSEIEDMRDGDEYGLRKDIQQVFTSIQERNRKIDSRNRFMAFEAEIHSDKMFSNLERIAYWKMVFQANKQLWLELEEKTNRLRIEQKSLNMELLRLAQIKAYANLVKNSYLTQTNVQKKLATSALTTLEPLNVMCRNRRLKYNRRFERFNTKSAILRNIIHKYMKIKFVHDSVCKALVKSWKCSSSIAKAKTNLENKTLARAMFGYSPKALKEIVKLISKAYAKKVRKPKYNQKLAEINRHRQFLERIINMNKVPSIEYVMTKYIYRNVPSAEEQEDILTLYQYANKYIVSTKGLLHKLKSFRKYTTNLDAPEKTWEENQIEHAHNIHEEKLKVKSCLSKKKERTKNYKFASLFLKGEIGRWEKVLNSRSDRFTRICKSEMVLSRWNNSQISRHSITPLDQLSCLITNK